MEQEKELLKSESRQMLKLKLQHFAEGGAGEGEGGEGAGSNDDKGSDDNQKEQKGSSAKDVQFTPEQQEKVNQIVADRVKAEQKKAEDAVNEAKKLEKMNDQQKQQYELKKAQDRIKELEAKENLYQMSKEASKMLADKGVSPTEDLLEFVTKETAEDTEKTVNTFLKLVDSEVEKQVAEKLKGSTPTGSVIRNDGYKSMEEIQEIDDATERLRLIRLYHTN